MPQMYEVLRVIAGIDGESLYAGQIVDASQWRNTKALVAAGRLRPLKDDEVPADSKADANDEAKPKPVKKAAKKVVAEPVVTEEIAEDVN